MKPKHFQPIGRNTCQTCPLLEGLNYCAKYNFSMEEIEDD